MLGSVPEAQNDAVYEVANLMMNFAFWHMKHAAMLASKPDINMDEAKSVHSSLRKASGLIKFVQDTLVSIFLRWQKPRSELGASEVIAANFRVAYWIENILITLSRCSDWWMRLNISGKICLSVSFIHLPLTFWR